jgi:membrane-bound metal-dependent hydrolase YbcI (DUF457 family)
MIYGLTGSFISTLLATAASYLPDLVECNGHLVTHRTVTHWPYLYIVPAIILWILLNAGNPKLWQYIALCLLVGCISHLIADFMSLNGIPFGMPYGPKYGLKLYITHHSTESITVLLLVCAFLLLAVTRGFLSAGYLNGEVERTTRLFAALPYSM